MTDEKPKETEKLVPVKDLVVLAEPFSEIFSSENEADKAFNFLKDILNFLGVNTVADPQFRLSLESGPYIDHNNLIEALKPAGVESVEDSRYIKIMQSFESHLYYSKWVLTLDFITLHWKPGSL